MDSFKVIVDPETHLYYTGDYWRGKSWSLNWECAKEFSSEEAITEFISFKDGDENDPEKDVFEDIQAIEVRTILKK